MATLTMVALAGTVGAKLYSGSLEKKAAVRQEKFLREEAARNSAAMTAEMQDIIDEKARMESRALSVAAASGAGVDDPTVVNLLGDLNAEGEYRMLSRLWTGDSEAQGIHFQADEAYRAGEDAQNASYVSAVTSVMSGLSKAFPPKATTTSALPATAPTKAKATPFVDQSRVVY